MFTLTDNRKIGMMLAGLGLFFMTLGVLLLFDGGLIAIGDVLFLASFPFLLGLHATADFFNPFKPGANWRGIVAFALGIILVLCSWAMVGMLLQVAGMVEMFGRWVPSISAPSPQPPPRPYALMCLFAWQYTTFTARHSRTPHMDLQSVLHAALHGHQRQSAGVAT